MDVVELDPDISDENLLKARAALKTLASLLKDPIELKVVIEP